MTDSNRELGMSLTNEDISHVAAFLECDDTVILAHLMLDHKVKLDAIVDEQSTVMLHMHLHGHVFDVSDLDKELPYE